MYRSKQLGFKMLFHNLCKKRHNSAISVVFPNCFVLSLSCDSCLLTFIVVVLHCDDASSGGPGVVDDGLGVKGFDGERVDHTNVNSF